MSSLGAPAEVMDKLPLEDRKLDDDRPAEFDFDAREPAARWVMWLVVGGAFAAGVLIVLMILIARRSVI